MWIVITSTWVRVLRILAIKVRVRWAVCECAHAAECFREAGLSLRMQSSRPAARDAVRSVPQTVAGRSDQTLRLVRFERSLHAFAGIIEKLDLLLRRIVFDLRPVLMSLVVNS